MYYSTDWIYPVFLVYNNFRKLVISMYKEGYFYGIIDIMKYNIMLSLLKENIIKEELGIIEMFNKDNEEIVIEIIDGKENIIKDTRKDKNNDITNYDLVYLKSFHRFYSDYEIKDMVYVNIDNNCFFRVKIEGYDPKDKRLKPFYLKKKITKDGLVKYCNNKEDLKYLEKFYDIKGLVKFSKIKDINNFFERLY